MSLFAKASIYITLLCKLKLKTLATDQRAVQKSGVNRLSVTALLLHFISHSHQVDGFQKYCLLYRYNNLATPCQAEHI